MHSSRMRTARSLTVSPSMLCSGGCLVWGVPGPGGCLPGPGGGISACTEADTRPVWTEFLTHACENITLPQTSFAGGKKKLRGN